MASLTCPITTAAARRDARKALLEARRAMPDAVRRAADAAIRARLAGLLAARAWPLAGRIIAAYWPMQGEPDPRPLFADWVAAGATLALPVVVGRGEPLRFARHAPGALLRAGAHGTVEPAGGEWLAPDVVIVPCVGFGDAGWRLGYGGGYYDRTLAGLAAITVGIAYEEGGLPGLRPEPHDVALGFVVTQERLVDCERIRRVRPGGRR
ncbi:MAG: 5-formyltetrahydrofolate cyclo-ligase [Burkholderiaceae bacterium]|nr:5-formyltetrahydrofolate cyclo-ligase [Burkholderiaceae bacterium]MEB2320321.1 5-formyltetrahydrofolate cyclo-ligase [Pseudomonadota bacterium]